MKQKFRRRNSLIELFEVMQNNCWKRKSGFSDDLNFVLECEKFLKELDLKLVWPATKVLQAVARANPTCASLIWSTIIPLLIKQFENLEQVRIKFFKCQIKQRICI